MIQALTHILNCVTGALVVLIFFSMGAIGAQAAFPQTFTFQGKLSDTGAAANGTYNIQFELCSVSDCSTIIWTEQHDPDGAGQVRVTNGIFSARLGMVESLSAVDFGQELWLRITVDGTSLEPSYDVPLGIIPLSSVPGAEEARRLNGHNYTNFLHQIDASSTDAVYGVSASSTRALAIGGSRLSLGLDTGAPTTSTTDVTLIGHRAGQMLASGSRNTFIGANAGRSIVDGVNNVIVGALAGQTIQGVANLILGTNAAQDMTAGDRNIIIGTSAAALNTDFNDTMAIGNGAATLSSGSGNMMIGNLAGLSSSASDSVMIGRRSGERASGSFKFYLEHTDQVFGSRPLLHGDFITDRLGIGTTGLANVPDTGLRVPGGIMIGTNDNQANILSDTAYASSSATLYIGNETINTSVSDKRLKTNITPADQSALSYLQGFDIVSFDWLDSNERHQDGRMPFGLIAQDVADIAPQYTRQGDNPKDYLSVRFQDMVPLTIKAIQEIEARVDALERGGIIRQAQEVVTNLSTELLTADRALVGKLTVGSPDQPAGITLYDTATGEPYCLSITNGQQQTQPGECEAATADTTTSDAGLVNPETDSQSSGGTEEASPTEEEGTEPDEGAPPTEPTDEDTIETAVMDETESTPATETNTTDASEAEPMPQSGSSEEQTLPSEQPIQEPVANPDEDQSAQESPEVTDTVPSEAPTDTAAGAGES